MAEMQSCCDIVPDDMLAVAESIRRILAQVEQTRGSEMVSLPAALNRVLAEDQVSMINVPQHTNSAMDGYAINTEALITDALSDTTSHRLKVIGKVYAGESFCGSVGAGEAVEITTGAPIPVGADSIVIREMTSLEGGWLSFQGRPVAGQHIRQAGEDIQAGSVALAAGALIRPQELGLLASLGQQQVRVYRSLKVAVFSTGDEVIAQGQPLPENSIYDTNRFTLQGMLQRLGCQVIDLGIIEDNQAVMEQTLREAAEQADMVISSGGVSMGQADYIKLALQAVGEISFWRISMRPGRPLAFGKLGATPFFGLPGNPVAVMVTFLQFVQPALRKMMGQLNWQPVKMTALAEETFKSRTNRIDYSRGVYRINDQGQLVVRTTGAQGSGILTSMVQANCLIEIGEPFSRVNAGEQVLIQPFSDLL